MKDILEQVQSGEFDPLKMFTGNKDKFLEVKTAIENISNNLTKETCIEFLSSKIIPTAFDKNVSDATRGEALEIGFHLLKFVNISTLETKDQDKIIASIEETYTTILGELRDSNCVNWDRLWIFLLRLCREKMHSKTSLANKMLRVVEVAFRNSSSTEQRFKAYDCWKELIDNYCLNMNHLCSAKQIKLLVTPLKAKFSKTPVFMNKSCDIFMYLLEKLQDRGTLCLKEFLHFCFGPFDEKNAEMRQGKSVPDVCIKSTKFLTAVLGHSHDATEVCVASDEIHLSESLINQKNFPDFAEILLNSVVECCVLLKDWNTDPAQCNTIIKCLWRSVFLSVNKTSDEVKTKCHAQLNSVLRRLLEKSERNKFLLVVLGNVLEILLKDDQAENLREILFDVALNLLRHLSVDSCPIDEKEVLCFVISCFETENGAKFSKLASASFRNDSKTVNSSSALCEVWLKCGSSANLIWPVRHLRCFKNTNALSTKWSALYTSECKSESAKASVLQEMEKLFAENPLLSSNIVFFLKLISASEATSNKDFVSKLMRLIQLVLTLPNLSDGDLKQLSAIVLSYCDQKKHFYKAEGIHEVLEKLCGCLEHLLTIHKDYSVLPELCEHLKEGQPKILANFSKRLMTVLEAVMLNEDNVVANNTRKLIELLETKDNTPDSIPLASTRSLRIINMANVVTPKPKPNHLKLFGKTGDTSLALKGNSKSSKKEEKVKKKPALFEEDKSSDYVKVDTEVKLNVNVLNEHQKEVLKKRREDIPALYSDLTQSQSQDFFVDSNEVSGENSKENLVAVDPKLVLGPPPEPAVESDEKNKEVEESKSAEEVKVMPNFAEEGVQKSVDFEEKQSGGNVEVSPSKRSPRSHKKQLKVKLKHLEETDKVESMKESKEINENKTEENAETSKNEEEVVEKAVRKSARQVKRKEIDLGQHVRSRSRNKKKRVNETAEQTEVVKEDSPSSEEKRKNVGESFEEPSSLRKSKRQYNRRQQKEANAVGTPGGKKITESPSSDVDNAVTESIEDLLDRVDNRILEEKRRSLEKSEEKARKSKKRSSSKGGDEESPPALSDGNQNKIFLDPKEENLSQQETIRQIVSKVKKQVMRKASVDSPSEQSSTLVAEDVYEFTGDDDPVVEDNKKSSAKKKKKPFGRDDYVKKRWKKSKNRGNKDVDEESFHITADSSPVPLSKSPTLRAVPSPQESETITIVITRSPPEEPFKEKETKKRGKRKSISPQTLSEDVIESSQPDQARKVGRPRKHRKIEEDPEESTQSLPMEVDQPAENKTFLLVTTTKKEFPTRRLSLTESFTDEKITLAKRSTRSRSLDKLDVDQEVTFLTSASEVKLPDTLTQPSEPEVKSKEDLPGSPINCYTPDRTTELLNNTSDISPISSAPPEENTPRMASTEVPNVRVARLLQMVNSNVQVGTTGKWFGEKRLPASPRVRKMRLKKEENLDILEFKRQVPSPLTVPASGILKRKFNSLEDVAVATPSPKRKRVNFSDPAITDKKIFIKDSEEYEQSTKESQNSMEDGEEDIEGKTKEEMIRAVTEFCNSHLKVGSEVREALKHVMQSVDVPEIEEVISGHLEVFEQFLPKLTEVLERLPDDKVSNFLIELTRIRIKETSHKEHEVNNLDCDKMKELMKEFIFKLDDEKRNEFLVDLMSFASEELPVTKEFINWHTEVLQQFVKRMKDSN